MSRIIWVFGSNTEGRHGAGAARFAKLYHGAIYGQAEGLQGSSYGIVTKELRKGEPKVTLKEIGDGVAKFLKFAEEHQELKFEVTEIGCGLAGFRTEEIAPLFEGYPRNVLLPTSFRVFLMVDETEVPANT